MKISLESSERIRKQQKELINMLQRSNSLAEASVISLNSNASFSNYYNSDNGSVASSEVYDNNRIPPNNNLSSLELKEKLKSRSKY